jgi:hypothetical protein
MTHLGYRARLTANALDACFSPSKYSLDPLSYRPPESGVRHEAAHLHRDCRLRCGVASRYAGKGPVLPVIGVLGGAGNDADGQARVRAFPSGAVR